MAGLGPFERRPRLAVAVSGGPDSLALCLLADVWARARGGAVVGLIVDHGLRPASADEARQAAGWLAARGIASEILVWAGPKPASGIQAAARAARYALLGDGCRAAGILHLLLGHHRDDQAETLLLRRARGSGADGQAGMAPVREIAGLRLLRPLLAVPKAALLLLLEAQGQPWLDDPSNRAPAFARTALRGSRAIDAERLAARAGEHARARAALDRAAASWLVRYARIDPAGFVVLDHRALAAASEALARRVLEQALLAVGGADYPPRRARLERLLGSLRGVACPSGRTLAGCRILPQAERLLICREAARVVDVLTPRAGSWQSWDRRFEVLVAGDAEGLRVAALGVAGVSRRRALRISGTGHDVPAAVRPGLPALWRGAQLLAVPQLGLALPGEAVLAARFRPPRPLAGAPFVSVAPDSAATGDRQTFASGFG